MIIIGLILHALLFSLLYALTDLQWYWAALIAGIAVWLGILVVTEDLLS